MVVVRAYRSVPSSPSELDLCSPTTKAEILAELKVAERARAASSRRSILSVLFALLVVVIATVVGAGRAQGQVNRHRGLVKRGFAECESPSPSSQRTTVSTYIVSQDGSVKTTTATVTVPAAPQPHNDPPAAASPEPPAQDAPPAQVPAPPVPSAEPPESSPPPAAPPTCSSESGYVLDKAKNSCAPSAGYTQCSESLACPTGTTTSPQPTAVYCPTSPAPTCMSSCNAAHGFTASGKSCATSSAAAASTATIVPGTQAKCDSSRSCVLATQWTAIATSACASDTCSAVCNSAAVASCTDTATRMAVASCTLSMAGQQPTAICGPTATCQASYTDKGHLGSTVGPWTTMTCVSASSES